jgi:cation transport ATPase
MDWGASRTQDSSSHNTSANEGIQAAAQRVAPAAASLKSDGPLAHFLHRPRAERLREYKYRCAQSLVFGLPVLGLQLLGTRLGGPEALRWVGFLQALLGGWVVYVGAAGMLFEGVLLLARRRWSADLPVAAAAAAFYLWSLAIVVQLLATGSAWGTLRFHWSVMLIAVWTAIRSAQMACTAGGTS